MRRSLASILKRAEIDADKIYVWIAKRSPQGAGTWYRAFLAAAKSLELNAERYGLAPEAHAAGAAVRQHFFRTPRGRTYRILYLIDENDVRVLRVRGPGQSAVSQYELFD